MVVLWVAPTHDVLAAIVFEKMDQESGWGQNILPMIWVLRVKTTWMVGIWQCLEGCNILLLSYTKPLIWWWCYDWPPLMFWQLFMIRRCAQKILRPRIWLGSKFCPIRLSWNKRQAQRNSAPGPSRQKVSKFSKIILAGQRPVAQLSVDKKPAQERKILIIFGRMDQGQNRW